MTVLLVALGGTAGVLARYGLTIWIESIWTIAAINIAGSFLLGILTPVALDHQLKMALGVGLLGGFTTLSSLTAQTVLEADGGRWGTAAAYLAVNVVGGLAAAVIGYVLARTLTS